MSIAPILHIRRHNILPVVKIRWSLSANRLSVVTLMCGITLHETWHFWTTATSYFASYWISCFALPAWLLYFRMLFSPCASFKFPFSDRVNVTCHAPVGPARLGSFTEVMESSVILHSDENGGSHGKGFELFMDYTILSFEPCSFLLFHVYSRCSWWVSRLRLSPLLKLCL